MQDKSDDNQRVKPPLGEKQPPPDKALDEALYDTFPASDPLPVTPQAEPVLPPRQDVEIDRNRKTDKVTRK